MYWAVIWWGGVYWRCCERLSIFQLEPSEQTVAILLVCPAPILQLILKTGVVFFTVAALTFLELKGRQR